MGTNQKELGKIKKQIDIENIEHEEFIKRANELQSDSPLTIKSVMGSRFQLIMDHQTDHVLMIYNTISKRLRIMEY